MFLEFKSCLSLKDLKQLNTSSTDKNKNISITRNFIIKVDPAATKITSNSK